MGIKELEKYICDTIKEWQLKIGDQKEAAGFYYPEAYMYCVEEDEFGLAYHRFTRADYAELFR